ncbi:MAG: hypothetical protein J6Q37_08435, partial [Bacteroidales bacterium]|nr:hypothetical protein [Bacteroidales bacterium]
EPVSVLDFPYFAKISCFFSGIRYSAIALKGLRVNKSKLYGLLSSRPKAGAKIVIISDKTTP